MARSKSAEKSYEASGKRPGTPVTTRLSDEELAALDAKLDGASRSSYLHDLLRKDLRLNTPEKKAPKTKRPRL